MYLTRHPEVQAAAREEVEQVGVIVPMVMVMMVVLREAFKNVLADFFR